MDRKPILFPFSQCTAMDVSSFVCCTGKYYWINVVRVNEVPSLSFQDKLKRMIPCGTKKLTRMHSSRIHTIRCSDRGGGSAPVHAGILPRGMSAKGGICPSACWDTTPFEQNDRRLGKHSLSDQKVFRFGFHSYSSVTSSLFQITWLK